MKEACEREHIRFYYPSPIFCTDNAAMIGVAAYYEYKKRCASRMGSECSSKSETGRTVRKEGDTSEMYSNHSGSRSGKKG